MLNNLSMETKSDHLQKGFKARRRFDYEVVVAGGGPAGSTAAALLAQLGHKVLLIEREQHPRFHIGESMLPMIAPIMQRLGVDWGKGNLAKSGADFLDENQGKKIFFPLNNRHKPYQIERSRFDKLLFENAAEKGAKTHQQETVLGVECNPSFVDIRTDKKTYRCLYFIDATGRGALMGRQANTIQRLGNLGRFALYTHYRNVVADAATPLFENGKIIVLTVDIGWIWVIPLAGNRLSIGLVVRDLPSAGGNKSELFEDYIGRSHLVNGLLAGAERERRARAEADFSFVNTNRYGMRFACCGDAEGFLDPVFSSGVFFAVTSASRIADSLHQALLGGCEGDPDIQRAGDESYKTGFRTMHLVVERFYQADLVNNLLFEANRDEKIRADIAAILSGDLWSGTNRFQNGLLAGRRATTPRPGPIATNQNYSPPGKASSCG